MATGAATTATAATESNMYRLGDYVYFENNSSSHYVIRRIEELTKTPTGGVEARVMSFFRRSELPQNLVAQADKHHWGDSTHEAPDPDSDDDEDEASLKLKEEKRAFKLREVFLSRQVETLNATLIRGKCSVTLLSEVETVDSYTAREDAFFYALVYDPHQKTLVADRGEIRIGSSYQATVPPLLKEDESYDRDESQLQSYIWNCNNKLSPEDIDKFMIVARSVGTFARALDCSSSVKQPSLHMSASAASRDVSLFHAYDILHENDYDLEKAMKALVPGTGPVLCRDEMEDWSSSEATLFEEGLEKYGKEFNDIRKDFLPWKSMRNIIEYFFMWKTTDRYVQQKKLKALENESKLKQVYVPSYVNKSTRLSGTNGELILRGKECEAYPNLTKYSWAGYKKYGTFVPCSAIEDAFIIDKSSYGGNMTAARLAQLRPGLIIEPGSPVKPSGSGGKTRAAFYLRTTPLSRAARRLCASVARLRHSARKPGKLVDMKAVKAEAQPKLAKMNERKIRQLNSFLKKQRKDMQEVVKGLGQTELDPQEWLNLTPRDELPKPAHEAFPRPPKRPDGSYIYERLENTQSSSTSRANMGQAQLFYKKRPFEESPGGTGAATVAKVAKTDSSGRGHVPNVVPPKGRVGTLTRIQGGQKQVISWMDAPDDVYYRSTTQTRRLRKRLSVSVLRRAARKPFKRTLVVPT